MKNSLWLGAFIAVLQLGCSGSTTPTPNPATPEETPVATGTPSPTPTGTPTPSVTWTRSYEEYSAEVGIPENCPYPWRFRVENNGRFVAGPCRPQDSFVTGNISRAERDELSARAMRVVRGGITSKTCEDAAPVASDFVELTLSNTRVYRVFENATSSRTFCFRDGKQNSSELRDYMFSLLRKYYPKRPLE